MKTLNHLHLGVSWGGFDSLIWPKKVPHSMLRERWLVRISVGLESPEDLVLDLQQALGAALDEDAAQP